MRQALLLLAVSVPSSLAAQAPVLAPLRAIGGGGPALGRIDAGAVAGDGTVILVDGANQRLYRFAPSGTFRDSLGRAGSGPGEFRSVAGLAVGPAGEVALADIRLNRVVMWSAAGRPLGEVALATGTPVAMDGWSGDPVVVLTDFARELRFVAVAAGKAPRDVAVIPTAPLSALPVAGKGCDLCPFVALPGGHHLMATTRDSSYRLVEFGADGAAVREWRRPAVAPRQRSPDEIDALMLRVLRGPGGGASPEARGPAPEREQFRWPPRIVGLARDGGGRIWVRANHAGATQPVFDVFSADGRFLGTQRVTQPVNGFAINGVNLLTWGENDDGEAAVHLFRIGG